MMNKDGSLGLEPGAETVYGTDDTTMVMSEKVIIIKSMNWRATHSLTICLHREIEFYRFFFVAHCEPCRFVNVVATLNNNNNRLI